MGKTALLSNFGVIVKLQSSRIFIRSTSDSTLALNFDKIPGFVPEAFLRSKALDDCASENQKISPASAFLVQAVFSLGGEMM